VTEKAFGNTPMFTAQEGAGPFLVTMSIEVQTCDIDHAGHVNNQGDVRGGLLDRRELRASRNQSFRIHNRRPRRPSLDERLRPIQDDSGKLGKKQVSQLKSITGFTGRLHFESLVARFQDAAVRTYAKVRSLQNIQKAGPQ
jgi:hypothetical protein